MKTSYRLKARILPALAPYALPTVFVPLSLGVAGALHAAQHAHVAWKFYRNPPRPMREAPAGAGGPLRNQAEAISQLPLADFNPIPLDGYASSGLRGLLDIAPMYFDTGTLLRGRLYAYPRHFHETLIPGAGGTPISAIMGLHHARQPRPGLVIVHGLMNSKRQDLVRPIAIRAFYEWGFNVCAIDLRGFGRSADTVSVPCGAGSMEAGDVLDVVRYLRRFPHFTSVGLLGFSLGAGTVINVAAMREAEELIDGGVMAVSPPINFDDTLDRFDNLPEDEEHLLTFFFFQHLFGRMLHNASIMKWVRKRLLEEGGNPEIKTFRDYLKNLVAWGYLGRETGGGQDPDTLLQQLLELASPSQSMARVRVPTFVLHAKDDPMTRLREEEISLLEQASQSNPLFRYHLTDRGGHTAYYVIAPGWFFKTIRQYFTYWGRWSTDRRHPFYRMGDEERVRLIPAPVRGSLEPPGPLPEWATSDDAGPLDLDPELMALLTAVPQAGLERREGI